MLFRRARRNFQLGWANRGRMTAKPRTQRGRARLRIEALEDRRLLSINPIDVAQVTKMADQYFDGAQSGSKHGPLADVGWNLAYLYAEHQAYEASASPKAFQSSDPLLVTSGETVLVDATASGSVQAAESDLKALGMRITAAAGPTVSGYLPIDEIPKLAASASVRFTMPSYRPVLSAGSVTSEGDGTIQSNVARKYLGLDGTGETVGVLSDSYNALGGASADIASGDLPASGVNVIQDDSGGTDEGRAMLQIVHDVAPGASLDFATASEGDQQFAANITALKNAGANVIVDDEMYLAEPMFQDGVIAQAVENAVNAGVVYVSAAGNQASNSFQSAWQTGPVLANGAYPSAPMVPSFRGGTAFEFNPGSNNGDFQSITLQPNAEMTISLQWDSPFGSLGGSGSQNDLDAYLLNAGATQVVAASTYSNINGDPVEVLDYKNTTASALNYNLMITKYAGADPGLIKYVLFHEGGITTNGFALNSPTLYGHANSSNDIAVAAEYWNSSPPTVEGFSSVGPTQILFDTAGNRITPVTRNHPDVTGPDGVSTTMSGFSPFYGTSAASPHVAGVAALMLQSLRTASPSQVSSTLDQTAQDMGPAGYDFSTGYGLVQAPAAILALGAQNTVTLDGTADPSADTFKIIKNGANDQFYVNNVLVFSGALSGIGRVVVNGSSYNDSLTIDASGGDPVPASGISYNGGAGSNSLAITNEGANSFAISGDANFTQTSDGWSLAATSGTISVTNAAQTTLTGGPNVDTFTVNTGTVSIFLGSGDRATLGDGSIGPGYANTLTSYADRTDFTGSGFNYDVTGVGSVSVSGTSFDQATVYDHLYNSNQSGSNVLDASTSPNTAIMRYWNGATLSVAWFGSTTAVQQDGYDIATEAASTAGFIHLQGTWHALISPTSLQNSITSASVAQTGNLDEQDLFTVGGDGLVREDRYYFSSHTDSGLAVIDPNTTFTSGTKLTAYSDGSTVSVFAVGSDGKAKWAYYTAATGWSGFVSLDSLVPGGAATFPAGAPLNGSAEPGALYLFGVGTDGIIKEYSYSSASHAWTLSSLSGPPAFPSGAQLAVWGTGTGIDVFGVLSDTTIEQVHVTGSSWTWGNFQSGGYLPASTPLAVSESGSDIYLFGVTGSGTIDEVDYNGSVWSWGNIISVGSDKFGSNAALGVRQYSSGQFKLYGVDTNDQIKNDYSTGPGTWSSQALGGAPPFAPTPGVALYSDSSGVDQVFGATTSGDFAVLEYNINNNLWAEHALGRSISPTALQNSIISAQVAQAGNLNEQDLFTVGSDGLVREDRYYYSSHTDSGLAIIDPNTTFNTGTKLAAYTDGSSVNVFAVGQDGKVKWAQYSAGRGWSQFVSLDDFIPGANLTLSVGANLTACAESGTFDLFAVGTSGVVREYSYNSSTHGWALSSLGGPPAFPSGSQLAVWDTGSGVDVFGVLSDTTIEHLHVVGGSFTWENFQSGGYLSAATPLAVSEWGSSIYLFGVTGAGTVDEIDYNGSVWSWGNIISVGSDTFGSNSLLGVRQYSSGQFKLYGVDTNGQIKNLYSTGPGTWGSQALGGAPDFSPSIGVALYSDPSGVDQVFGETASGQLAVLEYNIESNLWSEHALA